MSCAEKQIGTTQFHLPKLVPVWTCRKLVDSWLSPEKVDQKKKSENKPKNVTRKSCRAIRMSTCVATT